MVDSVANSLTSSLPSLLDEMEDTCRIRAFVPAQRVMCMNEIPDICSSQPTSSVSSQRSLKSSKGSSAASVSMAQPPLFQSVTQGSSPHMTPFTQSRSDEQETSSRISTFAPAQRVMCMNEFPDIRWSQPTSSASSQRSLKSSQSSSVAGGSTSSMIHGTDMLRQFPSTTRESSQHRTSFQFVLDELTAILMSGAVANSLTASTHSTLDEQEASPRISTFSPAQRVMCMNEIPDIRWSQPTSSVSSSQSLKSSQRSSVVNVVARPMTSSAAMAPQIPSTHQAPLVEVQPWEKLQGIPGVEQVHELIGVGTFSYVFLCTTKEHNGRVAAKLLKPCSDKESLAEAQLMATLTHPNLVRLLQFHAEPAPCLLLEFCKGGSVHCFFYGANSCVATSLRVQQRARMMLDVFLAVEHLHSQSIIHRDIKSANCFVTAPIWDLEAPLPPVKLGDLGLAHVVREAMTRFVGTVPYMAPELITTANYGTPSDIYSCCVLLHEAVSVQFPFSFMGTISQPALIMKIIHGWRPLLSSLPDDDCSEKLGELMGHGWGADTTSRVDATQLVARLEQIIGEPAQGK